MESKTKISTRNLNLYYGENHALKNINLDLYEHKITAFIGPSGCGKSTYLKTLNRMNDLVPGVKIDGTVLLDDEDIYDSQVDTTLLRKKIGMVFQQPNPFPMSIYDNIAYGPRIHGIKNKAQLDEIVENSLKGAALWDEVSDRLKKSALGLSGGQQQRLCIARALAVEPEVLLMDEPTSALDPISTLKIEDLMDDLKSKYTVAIVTHNMQQATRIADHTAFFLVGEVVEYATTDELFTMPKDKRTEGIRLSVRVTYEHELEVLKQDLKEMAHMVESAIEQTFMAFEDQDYTMAEDVIKGDRTVNDMERAIESRCLSLILRQQPVASDLRQVSTALKVVTDLERIGDHASDIAELILRIKSEHAYHIVKHLPVMAASANAMVHDAIEAFINQDLDSAMEIIERDDEVDPLFNQVKDDVIHLLKSSPDQADQGIDLLMVAKYLERIGDHAVNVCEWTQFSKTGALKNVRIM